MRVLSVCHFLPQPDRPSAGGFVLARLAAMAQLADLRILQPVPHFPLLRPLPRWARTASHDAAGSRIDHAPMFYLPGALKSLDGRWLERAVMRALPRLGGPDAFDVLDAHFGYPEGVGCVRVGRRLGRPAFVTVRGLETAVVDDPDTGPQLIAGLNSAAGIVSVSHALRDLLVSRGVAASRFTVIPNAVDRSLFRPYPQHDARRDLGLGDASPLVVSVGNLIELKRHHVLIDAFAGLRASWPRAILAVIGGGEAEPAYEARLRSQVVAAGLGTSVRFVGRVPAAGVARWLQAADVFALATSREGCCNAILEALATGRPVVTTPVGDNGQYVRDGLNGYVVPVDDREAMAAALHRALARTDWDPDAVSRSLAVGDWPSVARAVLAFFEERRSV